jgi:hypothetical protein
MNQFDKDFNSIVKYIREQTEDYSYDELFLEMRSRFPKASLDWVKAMSIATYLMSINSQGHSVFYIEGEDGEWADDNEDLIAGDNYPYSYIIRSELV